MTKGEADILQFVIESKNEAVPENDILNHFPRPRYGVERLATLRHLGYLRTPPNGGQYSITSKGLHALDEYLENQTRIKRVEFYNRISLIISATSLAISALSLLFARLAQSC